MAKMKLLVTIRPDGLSVFIDILLILTSYLSVAFGYSECNICLQTLS